MRTNRSALWITFLIMVLYIAGSNSAVHVKLLEKSHLIIDTSRILCSFETKTINVYFENSTSSGYSSQILQQLNQCGTSYMSIRSRFRTSPLAAIKDDGILMYLLIILHNATQPIELSIIQKQSAAKHLSHVLIVIEESSTVTLPWLRGTFKKFWQIWFPNVVVLFWRNKKLQAYRYNPFAENFLIKVAFAAHVPTKEELFPKRLPNMQLKPLRVCLYPEFIRVIFYNDGRIEGSDGLMAGFVAQRLNATLIVDRISTYGYENRTADLCLKEVVSGRDDMALNIRFLALPTFYKKVEPTVVHSRDDLCVLVPKAKTASTFWNLFRSYSGLVWLLILTSLLLAYAFCIALYKSLCLRQGFLLQLYASSITMPFMKPPFKLSLRLFLFCWFFYGMLICGAFKGTLTSNLVFRTYLPDVDTFKDLALSPYKLLLYPRHLKHLQLFLNTSNKYEAMIKSKLTVVPDALLSQYVKANNRTFAYLQKLHIARFRANARDHLRYGRPFYHVMDTCLVPFHAVYIVPYGSPYLGYLNFLIRSSHEFGYIHRWESIMKAYFLKSGSTVLRNERTDDDPVILRLSHFQAAFVLWALGLLVAFLVLLWEKFGQQITCLSKFKLLKLVQRVQAFRARKLN